MNLYETTFIVDAQLKEEGWESVIDKYSGIIKQNGSIRQIDRWGVRRLAYEIDKQTHGYYVHLIHESAPSVPRELERSFQLDEQCMRHLTVIADNPKYIEEMNKTKARQAAAEETSHQPAAASKASEGDAKTPPPVKEATPATPATPEVPAASAAPEVPAASATPEAPATPAKSESTVDAGTGSDEKKEENS